MKEYSKNREEIEKKLDQLRTTLDNVGVYVFTKDLDGKYTYANKLVRELFGKPLDEIIGKDDSEFFDMANTKDLVENDRKVVETGETIEKEEKNYIPGTGELRVYKSVKMPLTDDEGNITGILGVSTDITELYSLKEELQRQSRTDHLTKLNNRRFFLEIADHEFERSLRYGEKLCVMLFDIDNFKDINDTYGHHVGDYVLRKLAGVLKEQIRESDVLARIGGEEFALLLPNTGLGDAGKLAERIRKTVSNVKHKGDWKGTVSHTISVGIASLQDEDINFESLLVRADKALYKSKQEGRNRVSTQNDL